MTRTMNGKCLLSLCSEAVTRTVFRAPPGWTFCGMAGAAAIVNPRLSIFTSCIDYVLGDDHCYEAVLRSIDRASKKG